MSLSRNIGTDLKNLSFCQFYYFIVEVLDNSPNIEVPLGHEWRVAAHSLAAPRYDFALAVAPVR